MAAPGSCILIQRRSTNVVATIALTRQEEALTTARELRPLGEALGTEAPGIDVSTPLDAETFGRIAAAFAAPSVGVPRAVSGCTIVYPN